MTSKNPLQKSVEIACCYEIRPLLQIILYINIGQKINFKKVL